MSCSTCLHDIKFQHMPCSTCLHGIKFQHMPCRHHTKFNICRAAHGQKAPRCAARHKIVLHGISDLRKCKKVSYAVQPKSYAVRVSNADSAMHICHAARISAMKICIADQCLYAMQNKDPDFMPCSTGAMQHMSARHKMMCCMAYGCLADMPCSTFTPCDVDLDCH